MVEYVSMRLNDYVSLSCDLNTTLFRGLEDNRYRHVLIGTLHISDTISYDIVPILLCIDPLMCC